MKNFTMTQPTGINTCVTNVRTSGRVVHLGVGEVMGAAQDHFGGAIRLVSLEHAVSPPRERPHNRASPLWRRSRAPAPDPTALAT